MAVVAPCRQWQVFVVMTRKSPPVMIDEIHRKTSIFAPTLCFLCAGGLHPGTLVSERAAVETLLMTNVLSERATTCSTRHRTCQHVRAHHFSEFRWLCSTPVRMTRCAPWRRRAVVPLGARMERRRRRPRFLRKVCN